MPLPKTGNEFINLGVNVKGSVLTIDPESELATIVRLLADFSFGGAPWGYASDPCERLLRTNTSVTYITARIPMVAGLCAVTHK